MSQLLGSPSDAQFGQYTPPGSSRFSTPKTKESIETELEQARWQLGGLRLAPSIGIRQAQLHQNLFAVSDGRPGDESDVSAAFGIGLTAYLPSGPDVFWIAEARPEYVWWRDHTERRQQVGRYQAGVYAFLNRLTLSLIGRRDETERIVTPEFAQPVTALQEGAELTFDLRVSGAFSIFGEASLTDFQDRSESFGDPRVPDFSRLDRRLERQRAGVAWRPREFLELRLGWELSQVGFGRESRGLSVDGEGPYAGLTLTGNKMLLNAEVSRLTLTPSGDSVFPEDDVTSGRVELGFEPSWRLSFGLYAQRQQVFALQQPFADFTNERYGIRLRPRITQRTSLEVFLETGNDRFRPTAGGTDRRVDDAFSWGVSLALPTPQALPEQLQLQIGWRETSLTSDRAGNDRTIGGPLILLAIRIDQDFQWR